MLYSVHIDKIPLSSRPLSPPSPTHTHAHLTTKQTLTRANTRARAQARSHHLQRASAAVRTTPPPPLLLGRSSPTAPRAPPLRCCRWRTKAARATRPAPEASPLAAPGTTASRRETPRAVRHSRLKFKVVAYLRAQSRPRTVHVLRTNVAPTPRDEEVRNKQQQQSVHPVPIGPYQAQRSRTLNPHRWADDSLSAAEHAHRPLVQVQQLQAVIARVRYDQHVFPLLVKRRHMEG